MYQAMQCIKIVEDGQEVDNQWNMIGDCYDKPMDVIYFVISEFDTEIPGGIYVKAEGEYMDVTRTFDQFCTDYNYDATAGLVVYQKNFENFYIEDSLGGQVVLDETHMEWLVDELDRLDELFDRYGNDNFSSKIVVNYLGVYWDDGVQITDFENGPVYVDRLDDFNRFRATCRKVLYQAKGVS